MEEARLLNWGFLNVRTNMESALPEFIEKLPAALRHLWDRAQVTGTAREDVLSNLVRRKLVIKGQEGLYRTRFGETIRLLYLLRQRFAADDWQTAKRLVSDARIQL